MCGVVAMFAYGGSAPPVDAGQLLKIRDAMRSRGPDGEGAWLAPDGRAGLAHRRLAIIDLSGAAAQPMISSDGACAITFNGEIYNYRELRGELEKEGCRFRTTSDTEVLLWLYQRHGRDMVHRLRGMFAFALWDEARKGLLLARDPFGIKPLYVSDDGATLRAASQVRALLAGAASAGSPEPAGLVGFLLWGHVPEPYTLHKSIRALPAGSTLWIDAAGRKEAKPYFDLSGEIAGALESSRVVPAKQAHDELRAALLESVRYHLVADVPVGVFLSAGLDSTTLTSLAREVGQGDLRTVTLGFEEFKGTDSDETPLAEEVARQRGTVQSTCRVTREDFEQESRRLVAAMDQPSVDGVNSYFVSLAAARAGLKVALSGLGGDELFGGYSSFVQIPRLVKALRPLAAIPGLGPVFRRVSAAMLRRFTSPKYASLLEYGGSYGGAYLLRRGLFMPWELPRLLDADVVRQGWSELQTLSLLNQTERPVDSPYFKVVALESAWYMRNQLLRDADWASMAHSLEVRVPLVDVALFRAVMRLARHGRGPSKLDFARTPAVPLPDSVLHRRKTGFAIPVREWLADKNQIETNERGMRGWALRLLHDASGGTLAAA
jgi:asparagine synthase (glutamine-hydrolysing)